VDTRLQTKTNQAEYNSGDLFPFENISGKKQVYVTKR